MYDLDADNYLLGTPANGGPGAVTVPLPPGMPVAHARWNGSAWVNDPSREQQRAAARAAEQTRFDQAKQILRDYDATTASAAQVRTAVGALIVGMKRISQELNS